MLAPTESGEDVNRKRGHEEHRLLPDILAAWYPEPDENPFFAVIGRAGVQLFLRAGEVVPMSIAARDPSIR